MKISIIDQSMINEELKSNIQNLRTVNDLEDEKILCKHCQRSLANGKRCLGICVADSEY